MELLRPKERVTKTITGSILALEVNHSFTCINYKNRIYNEADSLILKCRSCKLSMRRQNASCNVTGNIIIMGEDGENAGKFYCLSTVFNSLFLSLSNTPGYSIEEKDISKLSSDMVEETLLVIEKLSFVVSMEDRCCVSISL